MKTPITIAYGDGIGPEIMTATLKILDAAGAPLAPEVIEVGEKIYRQGNTTGIPEDAWASLKRTKVLLKGPITTPQGGGYKSLNVTLRKTLSLFANVRACVSYYPYVPTKCPTMDLVIVRENEEGTYTGIEHRQTEEVYQCLKLVTRPGCERVIHYAFEYARKHSRKKVTCMTKDNIMKMTDGIFHQVFNELAAEYPDIEHDHYIIDIGSARLATQPEIFDVIVTTNLYGDILSDIAAQIAGSVGLAGSANIGNQVAMFEAIHGSAPDIAGKKIANPSGLLNAAIQLLVHINQPFVAAQIENAWLKTMEDGIHTGDIYSAAHSKKKVDTDEFAQAVIERLGEKPQHFKPVAYQSDVRAKIECYGQRPMVSAKKALVGVDLTLDNPLLGIEALAKQLQQIKSPLALVVISSRGLKIWPDSMIDAPYTRHCTCRFQSAPTVSALSTVSHTEVLHLMQQVNQLGLDIVATESLYTYDGKLGFSLMQGQ
jgi:isocitrate dehydrogenase